MLHSSIHRFQRPLLCQICVCVHFFSTMSQGQIAVQLDVETLSNESCYFSVLSCCVVSRRVVSAFSACCWSKVSLQFDLHASCLR